jgi:hypothetical protein
MLSANHSLLPFQNIVFDVYTIYLILQYLYILHRINILNSSIHPLLVTHLVVHPLTRPHMCILSQRPIPALLRI